MNLELIGLTLFTLGVAGLTLKTLGYLRSKHRHTYVSRHLLNGLKRELTNERSHL